LRLGDDRRARAIASKSSSVEVDAELARDREQVEHAVRRAAGARDRAATRSRCARA
jgi:hypothetical protein